MWVIISWEKHIVSTMQKENEKDFWEQIGSDRSMFWFWTEHDRVVHISAALLDNNRKLYNGLLTIRSHIGKLQSINSDN